MKEPPEKIKADFEKIEKWYNKSFAIPEDKIVSKSAKYIKNIVPIMTMIETVYVKQIDDKGKPLTFDIIARDGVNF